MYFFDVHPPFGKLLFAFMGWLIGYDGHFFFENIGDSYIENNVPYLWLRGMPAALGAVTIPVVFLIMWESGYSLPACVLASGLKGNSGQICSCGGQQVHFAFDLKILHAIPSPSSVSCSS